MFRTILLAYDGTLEGARALREGALLAKTCCAEVVLLSVAPCTASGVQMAESVQGGVVAKLLENHKEILERAVAWMKQRGFNPVARLEAGEPAPTIGRVAREVKADLVVVGHHKQSFLSRWWSGSTDAYLSDHIGCSLLVSCNQMSDEAFEALWKERVGVEA